MIPPAPSRRRALKGLAGVVAVASMAATLLANAPSANAVPVPDPDRNSTTPTGWGWHTNASVSTMSSFVGQGNRIVDLEPTSGTPTFTAAYAQNAGSYGRGWWWYVNLTAAQVGAKVTEHSARITDIEQYSTPSGTRFAVVLVHNVDPANKAWGYHINVSPATISSYISSNNMRIVDLDRTPSGSFNAVYVSNTGVDQKAWWYYYGQTAAQVSSLLTTNKARLTDIERTSDGKFDVVMQKAGNEAWWWLVGATQAQVSDGTSMPTTRVRPRARLTAPALGT